MSDLSRLLGDVYGTPSDEEEATDRAPAPSSGSTPQVSSPDEVAAPAPHPARDVDDLPEALVELGPEPAPGWADDRLLDEAFADWVPGPGPHAVGQERGWSVDTDPGVDGDPAADDGTGVPTTALPAYDLDDAWLVPHDEPDLDRAGLPLVPDVMAGAEEVPSGPWTRTADDLLPAGRRGRRLALRRR